MSQREEHPMSFISRWLVDPNRNPLARIHMNTVSTRLRYYGLRHDDLFDPLYDLDVKEALSRLPREIVDARNQRLLRAMDLSMKHDYLPKDLQVPRQRDGNHCGHFVCCYIEDIIRTSQTTIPNTFVYERSLKTYNDKRIDKWKGDWTGYLYNRFLYIYN